MAENTTRIPAPKVPFLDPSTGLMSREWYRFFLNIYTLTNSGSDDTSIDDLLIGPPPQDIAEVISKTDTFQQLGPEYRDLSGDFQYIFDQAQLMSLMNSYYVESKKIVDEVCLGPPPLTQVNNVDWGGTGITSYTVGDILYASGNSTLSKLADIATGNALISGGVATAPSWGKIDLATHITGVLPTANGGTNLSSFTANGVMYASSSSVLVTGSGLQFSGTQLSVNTAPTDANHTIDVNGVAIAVGTTTAVSGKGGNVRYRRDTGTVGWLTGILGTAAATSFVIYDVVASQSRLTIDTSGNVTLGVPLSAGNGGTGQSSYTTGDLLYASSSSALAKLAGVATGNALISGGVSTAPSWGKIGLSTHVSGTLPTANGGTNLTSFTANGVVYASSSSVLATGSGLQFSGTQLSVNTAPTDANHTIDVNGVAIAVGTTTAVSGKGGNIRFRRDTGTVGWSTGILGSAAATAYSIYDVVAAQSRLTIDTSGNVTLGVALPVGSGGTGASSASITAFNNITGYSAAGATGTTSTNLVFSTTPTLTTPVVTTTIGVGNATASASGSGVSFPATQSASTNANTLDDYEEGTYTPTWNGGTVTVNSCNYTKIGRLVFVSYDITFGASASGSASLLSVPFGISDTWGSGSVNFTDIGAALYVNMDSGGGATTPIAFRSAANGAPIACSTVATKRAIFSVVYNAS